MIREASTLPVRQICLTLKEKEKSMVRLKVTAKGQITLKKEVLDHLGISPGDEIDVNLQPQRQATLHAISGKLPIESLFGMIKNEAGVHLTIDEINEAISDGWANRR
ncbi:AbrB/MazE/SpoVT family DNA-binding domain-containing protein [Rhizobium sp. BE258]|jgi:AbrB family looped-hinge helix DNA binding protein|uniref:AbrB/MazE/SpoVT family DNA-binding domain-containing protein n=1 Tax=Rhizobium sp. BE258 TaxID=2817722 RepID=UPI002857713F|nr:AbrB/MazE/SpoVT family DNA-binding domain-containing protein [Rhizobium sp. BE258]MDR7144330.1 AbrB family looped-hinge helix DNA binding protein [Rhizobium sp. BE258]